MFNLEVDLRRLGRYWQWHKSVCICVHLMHQTVKMQETDSDDEIWQRVMCMFDWSGACSLGLNRFTLASCCCTYLIQDMCAAASVPVIGQYCIGIHFWHAAASQRQTNLHSATNSELCVPRTRLRVGERAFSSAAPRLWNALPTDIKQAATLLTFKKKLKTFLFSKHLCWFYCILSSPFYYTHCIYICKQLVI